MLGRQLGLFGGEVVGGDVVARIRYLLEVDPGCRDSYARLVGRYWLEFEGLGEVLAAGSEEGFLRWVEGVVSWKTIQNRAMELQRRRPELDASAGVRAERRRQARQGPVR